MSELKDYAGLRARELKLKSARALTGLFSEVLSTFLVICVLIIVLGLLASIVLTVLNSLLGSPWGTFVVMSFFIVLLLVLLLFRKRLFRDRLVKSLLESEEINDERELELQIVKTEARLENFDGTEGIFKLAFKLARMFLKGHNREQDRKNV